MSADVVNKVLGWMAGILGTLLVIAIVAQLSTWADVRTMKKELENAVKAEKIAALEVEVQHLKESCTHGPLWQAIGRKADK